MPVLVRAGNSVGHPSNCAGGGAIGPASTAVHKVSLVRIRMCRSDMGPWDVFLRVSFAGFAAILATVSVQSYVGHRARRFVMVSAASHVLHAEGVCKMPNA